MKEVGGNLCTPYVGHEETVLRRAGPRFYAVYVCHNLTMH